MKESFFIWNGVDCRAMGMKLAGPVAIVRPEERIQHVEIPGRSGDLTETQGADVFNSYIQTAGIMVHGGYRVRDIYKVAQSYPTLCDPMDCSTPGLPVHHQLLEFTQTHVHRVSDAI